MENSMKKLILVAAALMLLSVSLMGITFSINVINANPNTKAYITGWTGTPYPGPWTEWNHVEMQRNGSVFSISAPSNGQNGFNVTVTVGNHSSHKEGSVYIYGNDIWLDPINLLDKRPIIIDDPIHR